LKTLKARPVNLFDAIYFFQSSVFIFIQYFQENHMKKNLQAVVSTCLLAVFFAANLHAEPYGENTAEQKAVLESEAALREAVDKLNSNCGTNVTASIVWKAYAPISTLSAKELDNRSLENIYSIAGSQIQGHVRYLADACDDSLFKGNIAKKLKSIVATPRSGTVDAKNPSHTVKVANGVMSITYHFSTSNTTTDVSKKLF
jgi:hypothetical protein